MTNIKFYTDLKIRGKENNNNSSFLNNLNYECEIQNHQFSKEKSMKNENDDLFFIEKPRNILANIILLISKVKIIKNRKA